MRRKIFTIIFLFLLIKPFILFSEEVIPPSSSEDLDSLRDPFTPQLPLPPVKEIPKPANPPRPTATGPDTVTPPPPAKKNPEPIVEKPLPPQIKISGLLWNTDQPQAIINDRIVNVGDEIEKWTIQKIDQGGIEISARGNKIFIPTNFSVPNGSLKEPVNPKKQSFGGKI